MSDHGLSWQRIEWFAPPHASPQTMGRHRDVAKKFAAQYGRTRDDFPWQVVKPEHVVAYFKSRRVYDWDRGFFRLLARALFAEGFLSLYDQRAMIAAVHTPADYTLTVEVLENIVPSSMSRALMCVFWGADDRSVLSPLLALRRLESLARWEAQSLPYGTVCHRLTDAFLWSGDPWEVLFSPARPDDHFGDETAEERLEEVRESLAASLIPEDALRSFLRAGSADFQRNRFASQMRYAPAEMHDLITHYLLERSQSGR